MPPWSRYPPHCRAPFTIRQGGYPGSHRGPGRRADPPAASTGVAHRIQNPPLAHGPIGFAFSARARANQASYPDCHWLRFSKNWRGFDAAVSCPDRHWLRFASSGVKRVSRWMTQIAIGRALSGDARPQTRAGFSRLPLASLFSSAYPTAIDQVAQIAIGFASPGVVPGQRPARFANLAAVKRPGAVVGDFCRVRETHQSGPRGCTSVRFTHPSKIQDHHVQGLSSEPQHRGFGATADPGPDSGGGRPRAHGDPVGMGSSRGTIRHGGGFRAFILPPGSIPG